MASCSGFIEPLNLKCSILNLFAGDPTIFVFISFIVVSAMAARFKMRNGPALLMFAMFGLIFSAYIPWFTVLIILVGGITVFFGLSRPFTR